MDGVELSRKSELSLFAESSTEKSAETQSWSSVLNERLNPFAEQRDSWTFKSEAEHYGTTFIKSALLFTPLRGKMGIASTVAAGLAFAATERNASGEWTFGDAALGFAKGVGLKYAIATIGKAKTIPLTGLEMSFASKALAFGVGTRTIDSSLSSRSYLDKESGTYSFQKGAQTIAGTVFDPKMLATDLFVFGAAHGLTNYAFKEKFAKLSSPVAINMASGSAFGFSSGAAHELHRQQEFGEKTNIGKVLMKGVLQSGLDSIAAAPGGYMIARQQRSGESQQHLKARDASGQSESLSFQVEGQKSVAELLSTFRAERDAGNSVQLSLRGRELIQSGLGPWRTLSVQHGEYNPAAAMSADFLVSCNERGLLSARRDRPPLLFDREGSVFMSADAKSGGLKFSTRRSNSSDIELGDGVGLGKATSNMVSSDTTSGIAPFTGKRPTVARVLERNGEPEFADALRTASLENPFLASLRAADSSTMWAGNEARVIPLAPTSELLAIPAFKRGVAEEIANNKTLRERLIKDLNSQRVEAGESPLPQKMSVQEQVQTVVQNLPKAFVAKLIRPEAGDMGDGGSRPFDNPAWKVLELESGFLVLQERLHMGSSASAEHLKTVLGPKYEFVDPGVTPQVGYRVTDRHQTNPLLVDYTAVDRAGGADRTILAFTRPNGGEETAEPNSRIRRSRNVEADELSEGFGKLDIGAQRDQAKRFSDLTKTLKPEQKLILEDVMNSPEPLAQALEDAVITHWSRLGFKPNAEKQARQDVMDLKAVAKQLKSGS